MSDSRYLLPQKTDTKHPPMRQQLKCQTPDTSFPKFDTKQPPIRQQLKYQTPPYAPKNEIPRAVDAPTLQRYKMIPARTLCGEFLQQAYTMLPQSNTC